MRLEDHTFLGNLAQLGKAHHLETATIGQDRLCPTHEPMQAAEARYPLSSRPEHQVIGVSQDGIDAGSI